MAECLRGRPTRGRWLMIDDDADVVAAALGDAPVETWRRRGASARAWPPDGPFRAASVRLPQAREALGMTLHATAARLEPGGEIFVYGANDEGIRSVGRVLESLFERPETLDARRHCRVWRALSPAEPRDLRGDLEDWRLSFAVELPGGCVRVVSYPGVFAHGRLDEGSRQLIEALPALTDGDRVLDFGCGAGIVALAVRQCAPGAVLDLVDDDALAVEAARANVPSATVRLGDGWSALDGEGHYCLIVSNPPLHRGKARDFEVLRELCDRAPRRLRRGGSLLLVTRRALPVAPLLERCFQGVEVAREDSRFRVWRGIA
jgi:16S rRNA (guanine1207-N2)-methyltransferase